VAFSQVARGSTLWGFGLLVAVLALCFGRSRAWRLLRRIRFLLAILIVLFAFFTPGEAIVPMLGRLGPTAEGAALAATHGLRLLVVVMLVALLLERMDERALVAGLMVLSRPLAGVGLPVERMAVRLLLVFRYLETPLPGGWKALLGESRGEAEDVTDLTVQFAALGWRDRLAIVALLGLMIWGALR